MEIPTPCKALAAKPQIGRPPFFSPHREIAHQLRTEPPKRSSSAVSVGLSAEDDFEIGGEFLDVFTRASERVLGFAVGCVVIGVVWFAWTLL